MSLVELSLSGHFAVVELNDPDRRNALTREMVAELAATFDAIEKASGVRSVVLCAQGSAFCAGADRSVLREASQSPQAADTALREIYEGFLRVARCPLPTIAAVNGPAVGAGLNLALACDVRLASPDAQFDPRFVQLGLHPGGGHTWMMQRLLSYQVTSAMVLFGEVLDAHDAHRLGLVYEVVDSDNLVARAKEFAGRAAQADRELITRVKATLWATAQLTTIGDAVEREMSDQVWSITRSASPNQVGVTTKPPRARRDGRPTLPK